MKMNMRKWRKVPALVLSFYLVVLNLAIAKPGIAKPVEFYRGKVIEFTSTAQPGGGIYNYITTMKPFIEKYTGAKVIVTIKRKGGGLEGYSYIYRSKPDGLRMGAGSSLPMLLNYIFEAPGLDYDGSKFNFIGASMPDRMVLMVNPKGPYQSIAALQHAKGLKFGVQSMMGNISLANVSVMHNLDLDALQVPGYEGGVLVRLAVLQGEVAACTSSMSEALTPAIGVKPLFVLGTKRDPALPDLPALGELVKLQGEKMILNKWHDQLRNAKAWFLPPGVDKDKIDYLREVYNKIIKDPGFITMSETMFGRSFRIEGILVPGKEFQKEVQEIINNKKAMRTAFLPLFKKYTAIR